MKSAVIIFGTLAVGALFATPALAQRATDGDGLAWRGEIQNFSAADLPLWRTGRWVEELHNGRGGWWWVIGDTWYPYPHPAYPYPDPFTPTPYTQPKVIDPNLPNQVQVPKNPFYWYWCDAANTYYPYAPTCKDGWRPVIAASQESAQ